MIEQALDDSLLRGRNVTVTLQKVTIGLTFIMARFSRTH